MTYWWNPVEKWKCKKCGKINEPWTESCPKCGTSK